jgi:AmiR/NasT family two-component response regulator
MTTHKANPKARHLLVVDDDRLVLSVISTGLVDAGFEVTTAETAEDAEAWLAGGIRPDLAILDVHMPGQSGLFLADRLRALDHIPFMMFSAYSDPAMVEQANGCGALGYLVKPLDTVQLLPAVEAALARANELQALRTTRLQLQAALDGERDISVALGITMMQHRLKRNEAFELLRASARKRRCKLSDLATEIIQAGEKLNF